MRILSITAQKPHSTGSGTYLTELVRAFDRAGFRQAVVCGIYPDDEVDFPGDVSCYPVFFSNKNSASKGGAGAHPSEASESLFAECKVSRRISAADAGSLPFPIVGMSDIMPYTSTRYRDMTSDMVTQFENVFMQAVKRAVDDFDPDIIICHHLFLLTALVRKHFPCRRIVGISHGTDLRQMVNCKNLSDTVRPYINRLDHVFVLHEEQAREVPEMFGINDERVHILGSGYNPLLFNTDGRRPRLPYEPVRITYAGKISKPKGVKELLAAVARVCTEYMDRHSDLNQMMLPLELTLAGGCQDAELRPLLDNLPPYAVWLGQIPQPALAELLRQTDVFILPSYFEGLPLVLIEAMASGALPISTDLPGIRNWVDDNIGGPNVIYLPMPEMESIDEPTPQGRQDHIEHLAQTIESVIDEIYSSRFVPPIPDTSSVTWDAVADRLIKRII